MISEGLAIEALYNFFTELWYEQCEEFALQYPDSKCLDVDYWALRNFRNKELEELLDNDPLTLFRCAADAIQRIEFAVDVEIKDVVLRVKDFPTKTPIRELRHQHIHKLVKVEGIIRRASEVKPRLATIAFRCLRCEHITKVPQPLKKVVEPFECENPTCGKKGPYTQVYQESVMQNFQILEIQELPDALRGTQPRNLVIHCYDEMTDFITTGDKVMISGVLLTSQPTSREGKSTILDIVLEANHIEKLDKDYDEIIITDKEKEQFEILGNNPDVKQIIAKSIAPSIYGLGDIKEAMALQLVSGVAKVTPDRVRLRGDIHILLIGDPGTAKSQLVRWIVGASPRGIFNSGKSSSGVGLTAAVVPDPINDGRWALEGGSLVLADMGLCAVDEMDKLKSDDISALHEAMEQQTISVAKAGIIATLKSRCALIGAANPVHGRFDTWDSDIGGQINMSPTILSRFDLIFVIQDRPDRDNDKRISAHIINNHRGISTETTQLLDIDFLRKYIAYARSCIEPKLSDKAEALIQNYYVDARNMQQGSDAVPLTARTIDGLIRLSEASARLRLSHEVTEQDARDAIRLVSNCLKVVCKDQNGVFNVDSIYAGGSKSQRIKIQEFKEFAKTTDTFTKNKICEVLGYSLTECESLINKLKNSGEIIAVEHGVYKLC